MSVSSDPSNGFRIPETYIYYIHNNALVSFGSNTADPIAIKLYSTIQKIHRFFAERFGIQPLSDQSYRDPIFIEWKDGTWNCRTQFIDAQCSWQFRDVDAVTEREIAKQYVYAVLNGIYPLEASGESGAIKRAVATVCTAAFSAWNHRASKSQFIPYKISDDHKKILSTMLSTRNEGDFLDAVILPYAFYAAVEDREDDIDGRIAHIWLKALVFISQNSSFADIAGFAVATIEHAAHYLEDDPEENSRLTEAVIRGWKTIEVLNEEKQRKWLVSLRARLSMEILCTLPDIQERMSSNDIKDEIV